MRTRLFAAAAALVLLFAVCLPLRALAFGGKAQTEIVQAGQSLPKTASPTNAPPTEVYAATLDEEGTCHFLECGEAPDTLGLPDMAYAMYALYRGVLCEVSWRFDQFDNLTPGRRMLIGDILLSAGYVFKDQPLTVQVPVIVYDPAAEPIVKIASCVYTFEPNVIVPLGADPGEMQQYFQNVEDIAYIVTEHGDAFFAPVTLNFNAIDTSEAGVYYPIEVNLPECLTFGGLEFFTLGVHVVPTDEVDLRAISFYQSGYIVQWLYQAHDPVLWTSIDDGEWSEIPSDEWGIHPYGCFVLNDGMTTELELFSAMLNPGHVYRFQVQYDGDQFSDVLVLDLVNENLPKATNESGGDRNGGDRGKDDPPIGLSTPTPPPLVSSPTPSSPPSPQPSSTPIPSSPPPTQPSSTPIPSPPPPTQPSSTPIPSPPPPTQPSSTPSYQTPQSSMLPSRTVGGTIGDIPPTPVAFGPGLVSPSPDSEQEAAGSDAFNENPPVTEDDKNETSVLNLQSAGQSQAEALSGTSVPIVNADGYSIAITGEHLAAMAAANPQYVSFILEELRVSVPTEYILSLGLSSAEPFTVTLYQPDDLSFSIAFSLGDMPLDDTFIEPFFVSIPWDGGPVSCRHASSYEDSIEGTLDMEAGKASFCLYKTGMYLLTKHAAALIAQQDEFHVSAQSEAAADKVMNPGADHAAYSGASRRAALISLAVLMAAGALVILFRRKFGVTFWHLPSPITLVTRGGLDRGSSAPKENSSQASGLHLNNE